METFDNEISDDEDFEDELLPVATPVYLQQPSGLPPPVSSTPSYNSSQFDPFAPQGNTPSNDNNNDNNNIVLDLLSAPSSSSNAPVLIPMNPDADGDLLGGSTIVTKQASKAEKDPKMKILLYDDDDDNDLLMATNNAAKEEETADNFVDDDENAKGGGFFSRLGNKIRSTPTKEDSKPTNTESDTNMEILQGGGNSLPHPDTLVPGSSRDNVQEENSSDDDSSIHSSDDEDGLDGNGKSLPHPEEIMRLNDTNSNEKKEEPEGMQLDENGMSLPHPETIIPLRPPSQQDVLLKTLNEDDNSGSSQSGDNMRLMAALEAASAESDSDEDMYIEDAEEESEDSSSSSSSESGHYLDGNGNSLPHPDEHAINKSSGHGMSSFKWRNIKTSFRSTFNNNQKMDKLESEDEKEFADEEGRFMGSSRKGDEEMGYSDGSESESESESDSDFDDEDPSKKARVLSLVKEQSKNPKTQLICLVSLIVFILLFIVTPVAVNKKKNKEIASTGASGTSVAAPPTQAPFSFDGTPCYDEIVLTDRDGKDLVNGTDTSEDIACYSVEEPVHFRFKRCRPASPLDWVGVFSSRSMFMDKLWKDHYDGLYLCGDQPCPKEDPNNKEGGPPRVQTTKAPPITTPGEYRLFLVKDSDWPYEFVKHTAAFHVVESSQLCANKDNIFSPPKSGVQGESVYIDLPTEVPTNPATSYTSLNSIGTRK